MTQKFHFWAPISKIQIFFIKDIFTATLFLIAKSGISQSYVYNMSMSIIYTMEYYSATVRLIMNYVDKNEGDDAEGNQEEEGNLQNDFACGL